MRGKEEEEAGDEGEELAWVVSLSDGSVAPSSVTIFYCILTH